MKTAAIVLALATMLTVEQRDTHRSNFDRASAAVSADGRFVAFTTYSRLVSADTDNWGDLYVLDRARQEVTLESGGTGGVVNGDSSHPAISGDGRYVVFESAHTVVLRDRREAVTRIIGEGRHPSITEDGRRVFFSASKVESATGADANADYSDVYALDVQAGPARHISVGLIGLDESITSSGHPSPSSDGRYVAFVSRLPFESIGQRAPQIFVRDTQRSTTTRVGAGWDPSISGDGRFVAFVSVSNQLPHIFVADLQTGERHIITTSTRRGLANGASGKPKMSANGRFVVFQSEASDLVAGDDFNLLWDVFIFDRTARSMARVSGDADEVWMEPSGGAAIDAAGSVVAFSSRHPTDASDTRNDFDLYVATGSSLEREASIIPFSLFDLRFPVPIGAFPGFPALVPDPASSQVRAPGG